MLRPPFVMKTPLFCPSKTRWPLLPPSSLNPSSKNESTPPFGFTPDVARYGTLASQPPLKKKNSPFVLKSRRTRGAPLCLTRVANPLLNYPLSLLVYSYRGRSWLGSCRSCLLVGQLPNHTAPGACSPRIGCLETVCCTVVR